MNNNTILALILAAGQGKRMHSGSSKVLQPIGGKAMIEHLIQTVNQMDKTTKAIVYGHNGAQLQQAINAKFRDIQWVEQAEQLGTGHAVSMALSKIAQTEITLILLGDAPLVQLETMQKLCLKAQQTGFALLTATVANPYGYGRIIRNEAGVVTAIVEEKDATDSQRQIQEINTGMMAVSSKILQTYLPKLNNDNAQGEYYLTDLIAMLNADGNIVTAVQISNADEAMGINDRVQLAQAESVYRQRQTKALLAQGATLIDPTRIDIHGELSVGQDVIIEANVVIKGKVRLGNRVTIESGCVLIDCAIADDSTIYSHSRIENSTIGQGVQIGPFARIRPKSQLSDNSKIGNFVEVKAAIIGQGSKVNHLSYIGDATIGENSNIGAGTITCNYDGANKHQTLIGSDVFIGSNSALVAPITIGDGATLGAGTVASNNVSNHALAVSRPKLIEKNNWQRPTKKK